MFFNFFGLIFYKVVLIGGDNLLTTLYIENIAVIEKTQIDFKKGLNIMTGETGAGKSIVIDAINAILGKRISKDIIRMEKESAFVSGEFYGFSTDIIKKIEDLGYRLQEDKSMVIQREIFRNGKNACKINGRPATVGELRDIGKYLINIHGQHDNYELFSPELHLGYIDGLGDHQDILNEYREKYRKMKVIESELKGVSLSESEKERKIDLLNYQIQEIKSASLKEGELNELLEKRNLYVNSEKICGNMQASKVILDGNDEMDGALKLLEQTHTLLSECEKYETSISSIVSRIQGAIYEIEDCTYEISNIIMSMDYDPSELQFIEERIDCIYKLTKKYGNTESEILEYLKNAENELNEIKYSSKMEQELKTKLDKAMSELEEIASKISNIRKEISKIFVKLTKNELDFLDMAGVRIDISRNQCDLNINGCDDIELLIATNPGEMPKPISKVASGGELSRIMLAIKNVLSDKGKIETIIFDEVDTGISGSAAQKVGLKLKELSTTKQIICVTHLAQIAAMADNHFYISKYVKEGKTYTSVKELDYNGRKYEIARIIAGNNITDTVLKNADEMIRIANKDDN